MISASLLDQQKLFGLFELDPAGNVLSSRLEPDAEDGAPDMTGHNFFETVAPFENSAELHRRISHFTHGQVQADNFHFTYQSGDGPLLVRVLLARICERSNGSHTKSILVHIRKV